jgi:hypothetical protein
LRISPRDARRSHFPPLPYRVDLLDQYKHT